jgi:hypothetical protein
MALQNNQFWPPQPTKMEEAPSIQTGGSACGYKSFPNRWQNPTTAEQAGGQAVCLCIGSLRVNIRICR